MKLVNPEPKPTPLGGAELAQIQALALRQRRAGGVLMKAVNLAGGQVEDGLNLLPAKTRKLIESRARTALSQAYNLAERSRGQSLLHRPFASDGAHRAVSVVTGALGGLGGLPTALAELPVATMVIFRAIQGVAESYGEDPTADDTRLEVLRVFGAGGPGKDDDGIDTAFIGARMALSGPAVNSLITKIAPKFAAQISQKLASQAVPIIGAVAGAGVNYVFTTYYTEIAHVHFGLRQLGRAHEQDEVLGHFHKMLAKDKLAFKKG
ncbi:MAG: EcsC family protein [Rhodobacteraceae bacterium]|nr:EcsC family protein [Paracoccaceae bacterium]